MKWFTWLPIVTRLATIVAVNNGVAPRELAYLALLTNATTIAAATDNDIAELTAKYEAEVAADTLTTPAELEEIAARIQARGARIQQA